MSDNKDYFKADSAPLGTRINLYDDTADGRLATADFNKYLFEYFENINSGQCGWGITFISWLSMVKGWKHHGMREFERVESFEEIGE